jgi:hypothetical protein
MRDATRGHENGEVAEAYGLEQTLKTMQNWLEKAKMFSEMGWGRKPPWR